MLNLSSSAYKIRNGGEGQYEFFSDISTRTLLTVRIGEGAGKISKGSGNAFVGFEAGKENNQGSFGVFVGFQAGSLNERGNYCTYVGSYSGRENRRGNENTFVGFRAGELNKDGSECVAVGAYSMRENYSGNRSVAVGYRAAERTLNADFNTMIGAEAGQDNRSGNFNTMAGYRSGRSLFRGNENTYFGAFAGYSNSLGDGNCYIGYRAGYETTGSNNVSIGYNVGSDLSGNENVIIGANTLTKYATSGTVALGYNIGNTFETGNCNVFIGYGVDTYNSSASYSIAIGSLDVKTYSTSIVIGNNLRTSALTSVLIGRGIDSDSDNSVSIGNDINIESVYVFSDRLNYLFPVDQSKSYTFFDLQETYTDTIYNGVTSNQSAIFSKNTSNLYNSGNNRISGDINLFDFNLVDTFYSHLQFQGDIYQIYNNEIVNFSNINPVSNISEDEFVINDYGSNYIYISDYINSDDNIQKHNFNLDLTTSLTEITSNTQLTNHVIEIPITFSESLYDTNPAIYADKNGLLGINLIRMDESPYGSSNQFTYKIYFPKSYNSMILSNFIDNSNINVYSNFESINYSSNEMFSDSLTWEYNLENSNAYDYVYDNNTSNIITRQPNYGSINTNLFDSNILFSYQLYPESLFASNDSFDMATGRVLEDIVSISEPNTFTISMSNEIVFNNSNLYNLHPNNGLYLSKNAILRKPLYDIGDTVSVELGSNIILYNSDTSYTSNDNPISLTYEDIDNNNVYVKPLDSYIDVDDFINIDILENNYPFHLLYNYSPSNYINDYETSNILKIIPTTNYLQEVELLDSSVYDNYYIRKQPSYGKIITDNNNIVYKSYHSYNDYDNTELLIQYNNNNRRNYKIVNVDLGRSSEEYYAIDICKRHITPINYDTLSLTNPDLNTLYSYSNIENGELLFNTYEDGGSNVINSNISIPVVQLKPSFLYQKDGYYSLSNYGNDDYDKFIQKNIGIVSSWYQSNIEYGEIYYWLASNIDGLYSERNIYFDDGKQWTINYYNNTGNNASPIEQEFEFTVTNFDSEDITGLQTSPVKNFRDENSTKIGVQSFSNSLIVNESTREITNFIEGSETYKFIPLDKGATEDVEMFYISTSTNKYGGIDDTSTVLSEPVKIIQTIKYPVDISSNIKDDVTYISSNVLYYSDTDINNDYILYRVLSSSNNISLTEFSQDDINNNLVYFTSSSNQNFAIEYDIMNSFDDTSIDSGSINVNLYNNTIFPSINDSINSSNTLVHLQSTYENKLDGYLWEYFENSFINDTYLDSNELYINILKHPSNGYFYSSNLAIENGCNVISQISYNDFKTHKLHYIPYNPLDLSNDSYQVFFKYNDAISEPYSITLKNYWSKFSTILIDDYDVNPRVINKYDINTDNLPLSDGLIEDGYSFSYDGNNIEIAGYNIDYETENKQFTQRPYFKTNSTTENIDVSGFFYFDKLIDNDIIVSSNARDLHYFVSVNPSYGAVIKKYNNTFTSDAYFTYTDITSNNIFYKHYGDTSDSDSLTIIAGSLKNINSNILDVNSNSSLTYNINVSSKPNITKLTTSYIFKDNSNSILNDYNLLTTDIIDIEESGYVNIYDTNNINIYLDDGNTCNITNTFSYNDLHNDAVYYRIDSNIYQNNSNINEPMSISFNVNSLQNSFDVDPLSSLSYYDQYYLNTLNINLNDYVSSNVILNEFTSNQLVQYYQRRVEPDYLELDNKSIQIEFSIFPEQQLLYDTSIVSDFKHSDYLDFINKYTFDFGIKDSDDNDLLLAHFTEHDVTISNYYNDTIVIPLSIPFNVSTKINFSINDENNNNKLSLYVNETTNYLLSSDYDINIPSSSSIRTFFLKSDITDPSNNYNYISSSNISDDTYIHFNITELSTKLKFNDFNILVNTNQLFTENGNGLNTSTTHNVIIGKSLDIKGLDNICIGKNFRTVGTESIILGNNIGINIENGDVSTLNEIFQSIVIANDSFLNTRVRDVIAIGNNIFGDSVEGIDFDDFLNKRPVLIGNDISTGTIDFHINFQNIVLKTTYNEYSPGGIYLGLNSEIVAIGYQQNERFTNASQLYVNGGITYSGAIIETGDLNILSKSFGNVQYTSGNNHTLRILISWTNRQTNDYAAFTIDGHFKGIVNDTSYIHRRFETFITPKDDVANLKPKGLTDFDISNYSTSTITNYSNSVTRYSENIALLTLSWTTATTLTTTTKMIAYLQLSVSYPSALGTVTLTKL